MSGSISASPLLAPLLYLLVTSGVQLIHERLDSGSDRETINGLLEDYFSAPDDTPRMTTLENSV